MSVLIAFSAHQAPVVNTQPEPCLRLLRCRTSLPTGLGSDLELVSGTCTCIGISCDIREEFLSTIFVLTAKSVGRLDTVEMADCR